MARRGSAPGERRGGRAIGTPNKANAEIRLLARNWCPAAIQKLAELAGLTPKPPAENEMIQLGAVKELLDRGYGKIVQPPDQDYGGQIVIITGVRREPPPMIEADEPMISTGIHRHNGA